MSNTLTVEELCQISKDLTKICDSFPECNRKCPFSDESSDWDCILSAKDVTLDNLNALSDEDINEIKGLIKAYKEENPNAS